MVTALTDADTEIVCCCGAQDHLVGTRWIASSRHRRKRSPENGLERLRLDLGACSTLSPTSCRR